MVLLLAVEVILNEVEGAVVVEEVEIGGRTAPRSIIIILDMGRKEERNIDLSATSATAAAVSSGDRGRG